jgi:hypothetical protein
MPITATIANVYKEQSRLHVDVVYSDGVFTFTEPLYLSSAGLTNLQRQVDQRKTQIADLYAFADTLTPGSVIAAPPADPAPTQQALNQQTFQRDWFRWQQVKKAIDAGLLTGSEAQVTAFKTRLSNEFTQVITDETNAGKTTAQAWATALGLL